MGGGSGSVTNAALAARDDVCPRHPSSTLNGMDVVDGDVAPDGPVVLDGATQLGDGDRVRPAK